MFHTIACWQGGKFRFHTIVTNMQALKDAITRYTDDKYRCLVMTSFRTKEAADRWAREIGSQLDA